MYARCSTPCGLGASELFTDVYYAFSVFPRVEVRPLVLYLPVLLADPGYPAADSCHVLAVCDMLVFLPAGNELCFWETRKIGHASGYLWR